MPNIPIALEYVPGDDMSFLSLALTRATTAKYLTRDGLLSQVAAAGLREAHFDVNGVRTTLLEAARTNAWTQSETFDNAAWSKFNSAVTANALIAPDGTVTADKIVEDATAGVSHGIFRNVTGSTDNTQQAISIYARMGERSWFLVKTTDKAGVQSRTYFDLLNGVIGTRAAGHTARLQRLGLTPWYRISVIWNASIGATTPQVDFNLTTADNTPSHNGDGVSGIYVWGAQWETDKLFETTYIPTVGATATRNVEIFDAPVPATFQIPRSLTFYLKFIERGSILLTSFERLMQLGIPGVGRIVNIRVNAANRYGIQHEPHTGAGGVGATAVGTPNIGDTVELRGVLNADGSVLIGQSINGAAETVSATSAAFAMGDKWASNVIRFGNVGGMNGAIALINFRVALGVQTMATMQTPATYILFTDAIGPAFLANEQPFPADRFTDWAPNSIPFGKAAERLSDRARFMFRTSDEFSVSFTLNKIPSKVTSLSTAGYTPTDLADRLSYHLQNGGTCLIRTGDSQNSSYSPCGIKAGTTPSLSLADKRTLESTLTLQLSNLDVPPVRFTSIHR